MIEVQKMTFAGTEYIVMDKFEYQGKRYLCLYEDISKKIGTSDIKNIDHDIDMKVDFVYKCDDGMYENVVDDKLYDELCKLENSRQENGENPVLSIYQKSMTGNK